MRESRRSLRAYEEEVGSGSKGVTVGGDVIEGSGVTVCTSLQLWPELGFSNRESWVGQEGID